MHARPSGGHRRFRSDPMVPVEAGEWADVPLRNTLEEEGSLDTLSDTSVDTSDSPNREHQRFEAHPFSLKNTRRGESHC